MKASISRGRLTYRGLLSVAVAAAALTTGGCTVSTGIPGAPDIEIDVPDSAAQKACKEYAQAFIDGNDRETTLAALEAARATAAADTGDADAQRVAQAIDQLLTSTVVGTQESFQTAGDAVIAECGNAGVTITVE